MTDDSTSSVEASLTFSCTDTIGYAHEKSVQAKLFFHLPSVTLLPSAAQNPPSLDVIRLLSADCPKFFKILFHMPDDTTLLHQGSVSMRFPPPALEFLPSPHCSPAVDKQDDLSNLALPLSPFLLPSPVPSLPRPPAGSCFLKQLLSEAPPLYFHCYSHFDGLCLWNGLQQQRLHRFDAGDEGVDPQMTKIRQASHGHFQYGGG